MVNTQRTLEQLEGVVWPHPTFHSYLVETLHALRRKPIADFTAEDLRISVGQGMGLRHLVPMALDRLEVDSFAQGDLYAGDLLVAVLQVSREHWAAHPAESSRLATIAARATELLDNRASTPAINAHLRVLLASSPWRAA